MTGPATGHLDIDALADAVAGEADPAATAHLASCRECRAALDELQEASEQVSAQLRALPPVQVPPDVVPTLRTRPADVTTLPTMPTGGSRWQRMLPAAAAVVLLVAGGGYALSRLAGSGSDSAGSSSSSAGTAARAAAPTAGFPRSSTGTDYTGRPDLARAVPSLLAGPGAPQAMAGSSKAAGTNGADPLARLRAPAGLADCLLALLPPDDPSVRPLALDYASFRGRPALVVVLPAVDADKLDVYVVGPGCSRGNDSTLFYTSVPRA